MTAPVKPHRSMAAYAATLQQLAEDGIDHGLQYGTPPKVDPSAYPAALRDPRAVFVTLLDRDGELRGCIGRLETDRPLAVEVSANAYAAAFQDPRFPALTRAERPGTACKLSILTPLEPLQFADEEDLVAQLDPGVDGILIEASGTRGTLLPAVWDQLPGPWAFWRGVKAKAGLAEDTLPSDLAVYRYQAEEIDGT